MVTQNNALYDDCPYLHHDPRLGRRVLANHRHDGFRVLARLVSITGPAEDGEGVQRREGAAQAVSATFEVVGEEWAMGWLKLSYRNWIRDLRGKPIDGKFSLRNAPLGRFMYRPSNAPWDMMLLSASLSGDLVTPDDALRRWQQGATPRWFRTRANFGFAPSLFYCPVTFFASIFDDGLPVKVDAVQALSKASLAKAGRRFRQCMTSAKEQPRRSYGWTRPTPRQSFTSTWAAARTTSRTTPCRR